MLDRRPALRAVPRGGRWPGVPPILDAFLTVESPWVAVGLLVFYVACVTVEGYFLVPLVMGRSMDLNASTVLLTTVYWELVWGPAGLFLSMPLMAMVKAVCAHVPGWKPWGRLMETEDEEKRTGRRLSNDSRQVRNRPDGGFAIEKDSHSPERLHDAPRDDHGRRRRDAVLAAQPAAAAQAVPQRRRRPLAAPAGARPHRGAGRAAGALLGRDRRGVPRPDAEQLPALPPGHIVGEPCGRDTAPCIGLGAALIAREDPDAVMLVTPADHVIEPVQEFRRAAHVAAAMAEEHPGALLTFGITPTYPATATATSTAASRSPRGRASASSASPAFEEKPPQEKAERVLRLGRILLEQRHLRLEGRRPSSPRLKQQRPASARRRRAASPTPGARRASKRCWRREYAAVEKISIDYAVMQEHAEIARRADAVPLGRRGQLAGRRAHAAAGRRRQHGPRHPLRPEDEQLRHRRRGRAG